MNQIGRDSLTDAVRTVWSATLGLEAEPVTHDQGRQHAGRLSGSVRISGGWAGAVVLECPPTLAREIAALIFGVGPAEATDEQVQDSIGELTNIIGGNVKALLPGPSRLSLPDVDECPGDDAREHDSPRVVACLGFTCGGAGFRVTVRGDGPA